MAVREALLTLLSVEPSYGFRLHTELVRRLPHRAQLNVGQTYSTIERALKSGLIEGAGHTDDNLPLFRVTGAGHAVVQSWLAGTDGSGTPLDETTDRVLLLLSLGESIAREFDSAAVIAAERARWRERTLSSLEPGRAAAQAVHDLSRRQAAATVEWLEQLAAGAFGSIELPVRDAPGKRGRPKKASSAS